jgi:hypothetical protein
MNRKIFLILFCTIFSLESLFPHFELSEIADVPELWSHYKFHKAQAPASTFIGFLRLHYDGDSKHLSQEASAHDRLPFSKRNLSHSFKQLLCSFTSDDEALQSQTLLMSIGNVSYSSLHSSVEDIPVWQPPKL